MLFTLSKELNILPTELLKQNINDFSLNTTVAFMGLEHKSKQEYLQAIEMLGQRDVSLYEDVFSLKLDDLVRWYQIDRQRAKDGAKRQ